MCPRKVRKASKSSTTEFLFFAVVEGEMSSGGAKRGTKMAGGTAEKLKKMGEKKKEEKEEVEEDYCEEDPDEEKEETLPLPPGEEQKKLKDALFARYYYPLSVKGLRYLWQAQLIEVSSSQIVTTPKALEKIYEHLLHCDIRYYAQPQLSMDFSNKDKETLSGENFLSLFVIFFLFFISSLKKVQSFYKSKPTRI